jgi:hypothetical protein
MSVSAASAGRSCTPAYGDVALTKIREATRMSASRWRRALAAGEKAALASKEAAGARCKLTPAQLRELEAVLARLVRLAVPSLPLDIGYSTTTCSVGQLARGGIADPCTPTIAVMTRSQTGDRKDHDICHAELRQGPRQPGPGTGSPVEPLLGQPAARSPRPRPAAFGRHCRRRSPPVSGPAQGHPWTPGHPASQRGFVIRGTRKHGPQAAR